MNKKERMIQFVSEHLRLIQCPICQQSFTIEHSKSLVCRKRHVFDFAKQGYVNVLTHAVKSNYNQSLFHARHQIIQQSGMYTSIHHKIVEVIGNSKANTSSLSIVDLGCGEGSHLSHITSKLPIKSVPIGIDISKEGIKTAAKFYEKAIWLVGDLANIPLQSGSMDVLLNILSPANYAEFNRIANKDSLCIKIVPRKDYLYELRDYFKKPVQDEGAPKELFKSQVKFQESIPIQYTVSLSKGELRALCQMTPLLWNVSETEIEKYIAYSPGNITVDVDILVGKMNP